ncbi:hypothetical protein SLEP1_g26329 [Rubroshorea leprosula]|uniref:Uncharacterized protein n=1 Tax=Rubroshorea leprosula TaxID=152421 RepID=A0AAV5JW09_9ROSI|nr:hypothetical protein SLEP1_g26329 [Rubroshorea leprosula]
MHQSKAFEEAMATKSVFQLGSLLLLPMVTEIGLEKGFRSAVVYGKPYPTSNLYWFVTWSMWFLVASWLFAPSVFNPSSFDWQKTVDDWTYWKS